MDDEINRLVRELRSNEGRIIEAFRASGVEPEFDDVEPLLVGICIRPVARRWPTSRHEQSSKSRLVPVKQGDGWITPAVTLIVTQSTIRITPAG